MKFQHWTVLLVVLLQGCLPATNPERTAKAKTVESCVGQPQPDRMCTMQYAPVCGCNGKTYSNACTAGAAGILETTPGECAGQSELD